STARSTRPYFTNTSACASTRPTSLSPGASPEMPVTAETPVIPTPERPDTGSDLSIPGPGVGPGVSPRGSGRAPLTLDGSAGGPIVLVVFTLRTFTGVTAMPQRA